MGLPADSSLVKESRQQRDEAVNGIGDALLHKGPFGNLDIRSCRHFSIYLMWSIGLALKIQLLRIKECTPLQTGATAANQSRLFREPLLYDTLHWELSAMDSGLQMLRSPNSSHYEDLLQQSQASLEAWKNPAPSLEIAHMAIGEGSRTIS